MCPCPLRSNQSRHISCFESRHSDRTSYHVRSQGVMLFVIQNVYREFRVNIHLLRPVTIFSSIAIIQELRHMRFHDLFINYSVILNYYALIYLR